MSKNQFNISQNEQQNQESFPVVLIIILLGVLGIAISLINFT